MIDEYGRPILLLADQDKKKRVKGLEAYKVKYLLKIVKYPCCQISGFTPEDIPRSQRHGQNACFT